MKNKKTLKVLALALAFVLVAGIAVGATMAYLTDTKSVKNVFTFGKVAITLDEQKVTPYGEKANEAGEADETSTKRVDNNTYKLIPGHKYIKDPTVHVTKESEQCYVFVKVENGLSTFEAASTTGENAHKTIADQLAENGWTPVSEGSNVYYYNKNNQPIIDARTATADIDLVVFKDFTIKDNAVLDDTTIITVNDPATEADERTNITVTAYAVQSDGFTTPQAAWTATFGAPTTGN